MGCHRSGDLRPGKSGLVISIGMGAVRQSVDGGSNRWGCGRGFNDLVCRPREGNVRSEAGWRGSVPRPRIWIACFWYGTWDAGMRCS